MTPDEKLFDEVLSNALDILRLSAGKRAATVKRLDAMARELIAKLSEGELSGQQKREVERVIKASEKIIAEHYARIQGELEFEPIAEVVTVLTANSLEVAMDYLDAAKTPRQAYFKSLASNVLIEGSPAADWWLGQEQDTQRRFAAALRMGLANQETNQQLISRIVGKNGEPGVMDIAKRHATTLVQTAVQAVANDARRATFDANDDVIKGLRQISTLDGHVSLTCVAYSGASWNMKREPLEGSPPWNGGTPRHFKCRSVEVPITKTFRELGLDIDEPMPTTRASDEGASLSAKTDFDSFLRRKGTDYQDEMLGEGRADLWRAGKITLRDLVSGDGRPLSVEELRRRFA